LFSHYLGLNGRTVVTAYEIWSLLQQFCIKPWI